MIKDSDWTEPHYETSHMCRNGIQNTVVDYGRFVLLQIYSWHSHQMVHELTFFRHAINSECFNEKTRFWNCGDKAMEYAKTYAEGIDNTKMTIYKDDMSRFA
jgi:hypothetical protein